MHYLLSNSQTISFSLEARYLASSTVYTSNALEVKALLFYTMKYMII
jgi:hypothetical protein